MKFNLFKKKQKVAISNINVKWRGAMHQLDGMEIKERTFDLSIPFKNKTHSDLLTEAAGFKAEAAKPLEIKGVEISSPFKLVSIEPQMPVTIKPDEKIEIKMKIEAPDYTYSGPMNINFASDTIETIHVEISKVILKFGNKTSEVDASSRILSLQKGQMFSEKVQLYKVLTFGDKISKIEIDTPFKLVSTQPKLPFTVDDPNSYILDMFVQGPSSPYAGKMEITLS